MYFSPAQHGAAQHGRIVERLAHQIGFAYRSRVAAPDG